MGVYLYDWSYEELKSIFDKAEETQIGAFTEVKTPHGDLIDADKLRKEQNIWIGDGIAPTVIEAEVE